MFPLRDENPTTLRPFVTFAIIAANVAVWLLLQSGGLGEAFLDSLCSYGSIPGELTGGLTSGDTVELGDYECTIGGAKWATLATSMFMHGGWGHLIGNMWFMWVFGNNIEDSMGHGRFVLFYLLCGLVAAAAHVATVPGSPVPVVGASGAISGVMGAYLIQYPRVRIYTWVIFFIVALPAWVMLGYWFIVQLLMGSTDGGAGGGVAFMAHVGGFAAGLLLMKPFERRDMVEARLSGPKLAADQLFRRTR